MASYYSRRASYVASWAPQRIYPRQEPSFEASSSSVPATRDAVVAAASVQLEPTRTRASSHTTAASATPAPTATDSTSPVRVAPPMYYPGQAQLARTRATAAGLPPGLVASTNVASSITATIPWQSHPTATHSNSWKRFVRVPLWYSSLTRRKEVLWEEWPKEFGGTKLLPTHRRGGGATTVGDEEEGVTRSASRRSGVSADSGVALTPRGTLDVQQHALEPLFKSRIQELNALIPEHLGPSRVWLASLEMVNWLWIVALIVALGQGGGKQTKYLEGVELALIVIIVLNGIGVNAVRMRRWALARALRLRSRDWSPLPTTTSTNAHLLNNAQLQGLGEEREDVQTMAQRIRGKDQPTLRWRMRDTEGSWWISYRPIIKCELVIPSVTHAQHVISRPRPPPLDIESHVPPGPSPPPPPPQSDRPDEPAGDAPAYTES